MPSQLASKHGAKPAPNQEAHLLLTRLIDRVGLNKRSFLDRLADLGYAFSDDDFANWGARRTILPTRLGGPARYDSGGYARPTA